MQRFLYHAAGPRGPAADDSKGREVVQMTNDPRYSPQPQHPGHRADPNGPVPPVYAGQYRPGAQQPYDWRYATRQQPQAQAPYDPYRVAPQQPVAPGPIPQKRSRAGALTAGAVAIAVVSAGIGGGVALIAQPDRPSSSSSVTGLAPSV